MPTTNRQKLRTLMVEHDLKAEDVAVILDKTVATIHMYTSRSDERNISDADLRVLRKHLRENG